MKHLKHPRRRLRSLLLLAMVATQSMTVSAQWQREGSAPAINGQVEGIEDKEVAGAVERLAPDPRNPNVIYAGTVNGGVWMTINALSGHPTWSYISFDMPGQSIGSLVFDPTDTTNKTLVAGIGRFSSYELFGTGSYGVFRTRTGKGPWENLDPTNVFQGKNIIGIAARGSTIVVSNNSDGIWRTTNNGQNWEQLSGKLDVGLPIGGSYALAEDPVDHAILYAHAGSGLYKSVDTGATWKKISNSEMDGQIAFLNNFKIAVGKFNNIYIAIVREGILQAVYRSIDGGVIWSHLDVPFTVEKSRKIGIHPGAQGELHISLTADPVFKNIAYIGGDRQPYANEPDTPISWANSIGAEDFSGRLFRLDASAPLGQQFTPLTHNGTAHNSSPHADSRFLCFDALGNLIEADDGGIYKRTNPASKNGDWFSLNGDLDVTEIHSVAWDEKSHIILSGAQDTGNPQQEAPSNIKWNELSKGDGGDVSIDNLSSRDYSIRYSSANELQGFQKSIWSTSNELQSIVYPMLIDVTTGRSIAGFDFIAPIRINSQKGNRLIIASTTWLYESRDQGNTVRPIGHFPVNGDSRHALSYGSADNEDIIYAGSGNNLMIRSTISLGFARSLAYPGDDVQGITHDPSLSASCFVIDHSKVYHTNDMGNSWINITGNLNALHPGTLYTVSFVPPAGTRPSWIVVGSDNGIFFAAGSNFDEWKKLGDNFPLAAVFDLEYDSKDKVLIAGTMGLGAWSYQF